MAFDYTTGVTAPAAPDEIIDWFSSFETWIATVGWSMANRISDTEFVLQSSGELGGLTKFYVHIWRGAGGDVNKVYMECQDDAAGTNATTQDGYVDSGGAQFTYFMNADKDAINIVWKSGAGYRWKHAGLTYPFAATIPDETYQQVSASRIRLSAAILRNQAGAWDQDANLTDHTTLDDAMPDRYDSSFALIGVYFNAGVNIGGQLRHVSGEIDPAAGAVNPEDTIASGFAPGTCSWIVVTDDLGLKFAIRTGGVLPTGFPDGAYFAHQTGVAPDIATFLTSIIPTFLTGIGWTDHGEQGFPNCDYSRIFSSAGEDGNQSIFVGWGHQPVINTGLYGDVRDDLAGTHYIRGDRLNMVAGDFPTTYFITADRDCVILTIQRGVTYDRIWMGMVQAFAPGLYPAGLTPYKVALLHQTGVTSGLKLLRDHDGAWGGPGAGFACSYTMAESISNPNAFDGLTYHVWPTPLTRGVAGGNEPIGVMRYHFGTQGGGIANLDTITIAGKVYTIFFDTSANPWAMRTA